MHYESFVEKAGTNIYIYLINISDIPIYYNFNTNEIHGNGIYIFHPEIKPMSISALNPLKLRFEEERFINLMNPDCEVYYLHCTSKHFS